MKALAFVIALAATSASAQDRVSFGLGIGAPFAGLGVNLALAGKNEFKYLAGGCVAYERSGSMNQSACGVGAGWLRTDLFDPTGDRHGLGLYLGPVSGEWENRSLRAVYGGGLTYAYFTQGVSRSGLHPGATVAVGRENDKTQGYLILGLG